MQRHKTLHRAYYNFSGPVWLEPHVLRLRPRESHELRIESSRLNVTPAATLRWHSDVENNSVATATFNAQASQLLIENEVIIQQHNQAPLDFLVAGYATGYPFTYMHEDWMVLSPYLAIRGQTDISQLPEWLDNIWQAGGFRPSHYCSACASISSKRFPINCAKSPVCKARQKHCPLAKVHAEPLPACSWRPHVIWGWLRDLSVVICMPSLHRPVMVPPMPGRKSICRELAGRDSIRPARSCRQQSYRVGCSQIAGACTACCRLLCRPAGGEP